MEKAGIEQAVEKAGTQKALADLVGCTQQNVGAWLKKGFAPLKRATEIEQATGVPRIKLVDPRIRWLMENTSI